MNAPVIDATQPRRLELGPFTTDLLNGEPGMEQHQWRHWHLARDNQNVAWLLLDKRDTATNVLSRAVLEELGDILKHFKSDMPKGLVLRSAKPSNFCVGADIKEFGELGEGTDPEEALKAAHAVADRLARLSCPTVAVVHGNCLGGGLELALCCDYRLALPRARLGLPEVLLGLHPGLGGTARLTHLINPIEAMTLMLTGRTLSAPRAKKLGLVDELVEERHVASAVTAAVTGRIRRHKRSLKERLLNGALVRHRAARKMREKAAAKAPPQHYPAPGALIKLWEDFGGNSKKMRRQEIRSFAELLRTTTAQNLIRVFFLRERMKRLARPDSSQQPIQHLHVIGAGAMGGDIAGWCAFRGLQVTLYDRDAKAVAAAVARTREFCEKKRLPGPEVRDVLDRLTPDLRNRALGRADLVLEAVPEKIEIKRQVYAEVEPKLKPGAVLATNTSSIPLEQLGEQLRDSSRLVGLHFFNPVAQMQLVEVVSHASASPEALALARNFTGQIDRLPAPVSSAPGFLVNRALTPYLVEAMLLLDEGVSAETVDRAAEDFGMPMGPVELADQVGLDICLSVADMLRERLETPLPAAPDWLRKKVEEGHLGRKTGRGLYHWQHGKPQKKQDAPAADEDIADRLILPLLNACVACRREAVIEDEDLLDSAMIFGTGFAPFRGGPLHYARARGFDNVHDKLTQLAERHGQRFAPDAGWRREVL